MLIADIMDEVILGLGFLQSKRIVLDIDAKLLKLENEEILMSTPERQSAVLFPNCKALVPIMFDSEDDECIINETITLESVKDIHTR